MEQAKIEQLAFLYLCSEHDKRLLLKKEKMPLADFDRLTYLIYHFGFKEYHIKVWMEFAGEFKKEWDCLEALHETGVYAKNKVPPYDICSYPLTHMIVHSNGDIGLCCYDWKHLTSYANVDSYSVCEAWNSEMLKEIRRLHLAQRRSELPFCQNCIRKGYDNIDRDAKRILEIIERG